MNKWWDKFNAIALDIIGDKPHYFKEKWGRFDVTVYDGVPDGMFDRILYDVEYESEQCCQKCAKHCKQYRTELGWVRHFCLRHYVIHMTLVYINKFKYFIKRKMSEIKKIDRENTGKCVLGCGCLLYLLCGCGILLLLFIALIKFIFF